MYLQRDLENVLNKHLFRNKVIVLYGPRQSGKTTLIKHLLGGVSALYLDCELLDIREMLSRRRTKDLFSLVEDQKVIVFDEAQVVPGIGSVLKTLFDHHPEVQYIATGSSSFDLANTVSEPLTGRSFEFVLYPFSLAELTHNTFDAQQELTSVLRFGSYPGLVGMAEETKMKQLQTLLSQYLYRNILSVGGIRRPEIITSLLKLLAYQIGQEVSYRELATQLGTSQQTIERYIDLLEKNFVIFRLGSYARNLRSEVTRTKKVYFVDLGIRNALINVFSHVDPSYRNDVGALFENSMIVERLKYLAHQGKAQPGMYFWRTFTQQEVDYLEEQDGKLSAYEFKWSDGKTRGAPRSFSDAYPLATFATVTPRNAYQFILGEDNLALS